MYLVYILSNDKGMIIFRKHPTLKKTLRKLTTGETIEIPFRELKPSYVRQQVSALRKEGFDFIATEAGLIDSIRVTRIK